MTRLRHFVTIPRVVLFLCAMALAGCASRHAPLGGPLGEGGAAPSPLGDVVIPLAVRSFDITTADNQRGVFFKLSRVPDRVVSHEEQDSGRIVIDVAGPAVGDDLPVQSYPGADTLVSQIHISRTGGQVQLVVDFNSAPPPHYSVHQMADWIMVRLNSSHSQ